MRRKRVEENDSIYIYTGSSLLLHTLVFIIIFGLSHFYSSIISPSSPSTKKKTKISVLESAVRVDVVSMPKLTIKELKSIRPQKAMEKIKEAPLPKTELPVLLKEKKDFMALLKNLGKKKIEKKGKKAKKGKKGGKSKKRAGKKNSILSRKERGSLSKLLLEGNKLSQGTAIVGDAGADLVATEYAEYTQRVKEAIVPYWKLPSNLMDKDYQCRVRIYISKNGDLIKSRIFESSGNKIYDQKALNAVNAATPFSVPANSIKERVTQGDIILGFPL